MPFFGLPIRNGLPIGLGSVAGFGAPQEFSPSELFLGGTAGAWYDPSDLSTMFTTSAGTTPVAMPGLGSAVSVGLMLDKSQGLVLGSELVTPEANRDFSSDTGYWTKETGVTISGGAANWSATANSDLYRLNVLTVGKWYRITWTISSYTSGNFRLSVGGTTGVFRTAAGTYTETYYAASNGTFAITGQSSATGSVDNISVRELPGNHAIAFNNTTARPELRARVNLLRWSEVFDATASGSVWINSGVTVTDGVLAPNGTNTADTITGTTGTYPHVRQAITLPAAGTYKASCYFQKTSGATRFPSIELNFAPGNAWVVLNTDTGVAANAQGTPTNISVSDAGGYWLVSFDVAVNITSATFFIYPASSSNGTSFAPNLTGSCVAWGADLRPANIGANVPAYQRIADANTYDTSGFPLYLRFDGIDDSMYTPANLNLSGTDKVSVFAGVRKLSDANTGTVVQFSSSTATNNGVFGLFAPFNTGASADYAWQSKGTARITINSGVLTGPATSVFTGIGDVPAPLATLRQNAAQAATSTGSQGTGNFGNFALFVGEGAGFLNGHLHSLIIAGSAVSAGNISATEQWVAQRTGIVIP